jgi:hypothetical protein
VERQKFSHPSPTSQKTTMTRGVGGECVSVLHGVREEMRESEISLQSSKQWENVVAVSAPCKLLICINTFLCLG